MDRNDRSRLVFRAEAHERATKPKGRASGALGLTGLAVLRCIAFRFLNVAKGCAWPSYDALQKATGFARQTIADAIRRIEAAGFMRVQRRARFIKGQLVKLTNLYTLMIDPPPLPLWESLAARRQPEDSRFIPYSELSDDSPLKKALAKLGAAIAAAT